jgi:hypothetical protein
MECNVGGWDRTLRATLLGAAIGLGTRPSLHPLLRVASAVAAAMAAFTVVTQYCPINHALGINTCSDQADNSRSKDRGGRYLEERRPEHYTG